MKKIWIASAAVVVLSGSVFADTVTSTGTSTGGFISVPITTTIQSNQTPYTGANILTNNQVPFWDNGSSDIVGSNTSHQINVGDILAGLVVGNVIGSDLVGGNVNGTYYAAAGGTDPINGNAPTVSAGITTDSTPLAFNLVRSATAMNISILFADSGNNPTTTFGTYVGSTYTPIYTGLSNNTSGTANQTMAFNPTGTGTGYGFYATVCYSTGCETYTTGNGNFGISDPAGGANNGQAWNHFAVFQLASGKMVIGFDDGNGQYTEGIGDFNDIVIQLTTAPAPEPGTIVMMGFGLAGLGILGRRRFAKK